MSRMYYSYTYKNYEGCKAATDYSKQRYSYSGLVTAAISVAGFVSFIALCFGIGELFIEEYSFSPFVCSYAVFGAVFSFVFYHSAIRSFITDMRCEVSVAKTRFALSPYLEGIIRLTAKKYQALITSYVVKLLKILIYLSIFCATLVLIKGLLIVYSGEFFGFLVFGTGVAVDITLLLLRNAIPTLIEPSIKSKVERIKFDSLSYFL